MTTSDDQIGNLVQTLGDLLTALDEGRYRFDEVHVRADLNYLRAEARRAQEHLSVLRDLAASRLYAMEVWRARAQEPRRVGLLGDAETCQRCGGENVIWFAPSPLWNRVMRGNDIDGEPRYGDLACIRCFIVLAYEAGIDGTWRLSVSPEPEGLIYETPSGRIWDPESWLWRDPEVSTPPGEPT